jgi:hypothetical protein
MRLLMTTGMTSQDDAEYPLPDIDEDLEIANMTPEPGHIDDPETAESETEHDDRSE